MCLGGTRVAIRTPLALVSLFALAACVAVPGPRSGARVGLAKPYTLTKIGDVSGLFAIKLANLARIDPAHPLADDNAAQTLSMFGREDLIAATGDYYRPTRCAALMPTVDALDEIARRASATSIVIVNESHDTSEHRGFTAEIARRLRTLGYDTLALETLANNPPSTPARYLPTFLKQPALPFLVDDDGFYLSEAGFGRLGRQAKALGYRLVPYEINDEDTMPPDATDDQRIAVREEAQARNLAAYVASHPGAKLLIHVGYHHAIEVPRTDGTKWMAARLKQKTGVDPLTISQTSCRGGGNTTRLAVPPRDEPAGAFDLVVDHPVARFERGRPAWRQQAGDVPVAIPRALRPRTGWRVIEARPVGEPDTSVPIDRVAIRPKDDTFLMVPAGRYRLRAIDVARSGPPTGSTDKKPGG